MRVIHPTEGSKGLAPEDIFLAINHQNITVAEGYVVTTHHPSLFPERPLNLYLCARFDSGGDFILGALMGRVQQIHEQNMAVSMRAFAQVSPQDKALLDLYLGAGFDQSDGLDIVVLQQPFAASTNDNLRIELTPIGPGPTEQAFLGRMNASRLIPWNLQQLRRYMSTPNFLALSMINEFHQIVGSIAFLGQGEKTTLLGIHVEPAYRKKGIAKRLIQAGMNTLAQRGVKRVEAEVVRRCPQQRALAQSCRAMLVRTAFLYPGMNYDS